MPLKNTKTINRPPPTVDRGAGLSTVKGVAVDCIRRFSNVFVTIRGEGGAKASIPSAPGGGSDRAGGGRPGHSSSRARERTLGHSTLKSPLGRGPNPSKPGLALAPGAPGAPEAPEVSWARERERERRECEREGENPRPGFSVSTHSGSPASRHHLASHLASHRASCISLCVSLCIPQCCTPYLTMSSEARRSYLCWSPGATRSNSPGIDSYGLIYNSNEHLTTS